MHPGTAQRPKRVRLGQLTLFFPDAPKRPRDDFSEKIVLEVISGGSESYLGGPPGFGEEHGEWSHFRSSQNPGGPPKYLSELPESTSSSILSRKSSLGRFGVSGKKRVSCPGRPRLGLCAFPWCNCCCWAVSSKPLKNHCVFKDFQHFGVSKAPAEWRQYYLNIIWARPK